MAAVNRVDRNLMERLSRLSRLKLLIPLKRSIHPSEHSARGVAVGMFWAMTPLVGIQMYLCFMTWLIAKPFRRLQFSLVIAFAWTWVTNVFTMLPIYYVFYVTGRVMMGEHENITGYVTFLESWNIAFVEGHGFWRATLQLATMLARELGLSMLIGSIPWAVASAWASYYLSLKYIRRRRRKIVEKRSLKAVKEGRAVSAQRAERPSA